METPRKLAKESTMAPFNRILLCYDATPEGRLALRCGAALAQQLQAETHLLSISDCTHWAGGFDVLSSLRFEFDEQAAQETLREGIHWLQAWGVTATGHYSVGNAIASDLSPGGFVEG
jgi:hypothetical protein